MQSLLRLHCSSDLQEPELAEGALNKLTFVCAQAILRISDDIVL
jgi:hypothetical protein